jgi:hypothetical protein
MPAYCRFLVNKAVRALLVPISCVESSKILHNIFHYLTHVCRRRTYLLMPSLVNHSPKAGG